MGLLVSWLSVVHFGHTGVTDRCLLGPAAKTAGKSRSSRPSSRERSPNSCRGRSFAAKQRARIRKDGPDGRRSRLSATTPTSCYAGVDVSKGRLDIFLRPMQEHLSVPNDEAGIGALVSRLEQACPALVVLESSGGFERLVAAALAASELPIVVVNPRQVRYYFARATGKLAKTDRLDAEVLARFGEAVGPEPKPLPDKEVRAFGEVLARRRQIVGMITAERNRLGTATSEPVKKGIEAHV